VRNSDFSTFAFRNLHMIDWDKCTVIDLVGSDRLLIDARATFKTGNKGKEREAVRLAGIARRKAGPTAVLRSMQIGAAHTFPQYRVRAQIATMISYCNGAEFVCTTVAEGLRVARIK
jgi:hypothetical protein